MSTQYETVTIQTSGANPSTLAVTVPVDTTTGSGSATFSYTGANGGVDTLQGMATIAGTAYTSNTAQVSWQATNGTIQVGSTVTGYGWNDSPGSGNVATYLWKNPNDTAATNAISRTISTALATQVNNSLSFDGTGGGSDGAPPAWDTFNALGQNVGSINFPPYGSNFNAIIQAYLLIPAPGVYNLTATYKDGIIWGIGASPTGATLTWAGVGTIVAPFGQTMTVAGGFPLLPAPQNNGGGGYEGSSTIAVTASQAGIYPIEVGWDYWYHSGRTMHITSSSGEIAPVDLVTVPPASTPTGNLTITPAGGNTNFQISGQPITLTVNVSGITYPTKSYCPVYEGVTGNLFLYNDSNSTTFNFPTYNGNLVNKTAAVTNVFKLSSLDNTAYQGLLSLGYDGTNFTLRYNGGTANPNATSRVASSSLVVTADDIAWYNGADSSFDLFSIAGNTGGISYNLEVDYMNKPSVASLTPTTIAANGDSYTLAISLNKGFSPQQQGAKNTGNSVTAMCTITGATATGTPVAILDANGWLTGWNVAFTAPYATTNQTLNVNLTVSGTLTYLSGTTFVTETVTYITGQIGVISASGTSYVAPVAQSLSFTPTGPSYPATITSVTATAQVFTPGGNEPLSCTFFTQSVGQSPTTTLGVGTPVSSSAATIGGVAGYLQVFSYIFNPQISLGVAPGNYIGYTAVNSVSGLNCTYTSTTAYAHTFSSGTGTGCPAVTMYLKEGLQVKEVEVGDKLDALEDNYEEVQLSVLDRVFGYEECYRLETENGAVVVISESTPVPTLETLAALKEGVPSDALPLYANAIRSGMHVFTNIEGRKETSMLVETSRIGLKKVARIYIGGKNFAAGVDPTKRIYTHNASSGVVK